MSINRRELLPALGGLGLAGCGIVQGRSGQGAVDKLISLDDFESRARGRMSEMAYEYVAGGAGDEITVRWNREAFSKLQLRPRSLVDVSTIDTRQTLVGTPLDHPILLAPTGYHRLIHPEGEIATAQGAGAAQALMVVELERDHPGRADCPGGPGAALVPALHAGGPRLHPGPGGPGGGGRVPGSLPDRGCAGGRRAQPRAPHALRGASRPGRADEPAVQPGPAGREDPGPHAAVPAFSRHLARPRVAALDHPPAHPAQGDPRRRRRRPGGAGGRRRHHRLQPRRPLPRLRPRHPGRPARSGRQGAGPHPRAHGRRHPPRHRRAQGPGAAAPTP